MILPLVEADGAGAPSLHHCTLWRGNGSWAKVGTAPLCRPQPGLSSTLPFVGADGTGKMRLSECKQELVLALPSMSILSNAVPTGGGHCGGNGRQGCVGTASLCRPQPGLPAILPKVEADGTGVPSLQLPGHSRGTPRPYMGLKKGVPIGTPFLIGLCVVISGQPPCGHCGCRCRRGGCRSPSDP